MNPLLLRCAHGTPVALLCACSASGRIRVTAMTVTGRDKAVAIVDAKLGFLVATHGTPLVYSLLFRIVMAAGALRPAPLYVPATVWVRDDVMSLRALGHVQSLEFSWIDPASHRIGAMLRLHVVERRCGCHIAPRFAST